MTGWMPDGQRCTANCLFPVSVVKSASASNNQALGMDYYDYPSGGRIYALISYVDDTHVTGQIGSIYGIKVWGIK